MTAPVMDGCEPLSVDGSQTGVLVLHGFTGNPFAMRGVAQRAADAGFSVEMPILPGHGTALEDLMPMRFEDWSGEAEAAYQRLAARTQRVVVVGLSMGGTLSCWLAERHPEIAGLVLINPAVEPPSAELIEGIQALLDGGTETIEAIGSDIAKEGAEERSYPATPVAALLSLLKGVDEVSGALETIACPVLLFSSPEDHVVPPSNGDFLVSKVAGPLERIFCTKSYHVATLDHDAELVETSAISFVERIALESAS